MLKTPQSVQSAAYVWKAGGTQRLTNQTQNHKKGIFMPSPMLFVYKRSFFLLAIFAVLSACQSEPKPDELRMEALEYSARASELEFEGRYLPPSAASEKSKREQFIYTLLQLAKAKRELIGNPSYPNALQETKDYISMAQGVYDSRTQISNLELTQTFTWTKQWTKIFSDLLYNFKDNTFWAEYSLLKPTIFLYPFVFMGSNVAWLGASPITLIRDTFFGWETHSEGSRDMGVNPKWQDEINAARESISEDAYQHLIQKNEKPKNLYVSLYYALTGTQPQCLKWLAMGGLQSIPGTTADSAHGYRKDETLPYQHVWNEFIDDLKEELEDSNGYYFENEKTHISISPSRPEKSVLQTTLFEEEPLLIVHVKQLVYIPAEHIQSLTTWVNSQSESEFHIFFDTEFPAAGDEDLEATLDYEQSFLKTNFQK
ncbi:MAG: hypothetical protein HY390_06065 [Deltaproteobacteria bacterium]|nr:hypothetical protein [Deltaproteobacteria bacterium]